MSDDANALIRDLEAMGPPAWLVDMIEYHRRTGCYRPEDLRRLLGDPCRGVSIGPDTTVEDMLGLRK